MALCADKIEDRVTALEDKFQMLAVKKEDLIRNRQVTVPPIHLGGFKASFQSDEVIFAQLFLEPVTLICAVYLEDLPKDTVASIHISRSGVATLGESTDTMVLPIAKGLTLINPVLTVGKHSRFSAMVVYAGVQPPTGIWFSARCQA